MLRMVLMVSLALSFVLAFSGAALSADYVGAAKCKICHKGEKNGNIYEIWEGSQHAKAYETLVAKGDSSEKNPDCLACHTTGFDKLTGFSLADSTVNMDLANVGCEDCHGPGSEYKTMSVMKDKEKAIAAGLVIPDEKTCVTCHNENSPTFKGFDYAEYYKKIEHHVPKKEE